MFVALLFAALAGAAQAPKKAAPSPTGKAPARPASVQPKEMTPAEIEAGWKAGRKILLIDVRSPGEFRQGHPEDAINVPLERLPKHMKELQVPKPTELVVICQSAAVAPQAVSELMKLGYSKVFYTTFEEWKKAGFKVDKVATPPRK